MKLKLAATSVVIAFALTSMTVHAADSDTDRNNPATFVKDSAITTNIKTKLATENLGSMKHIKVDTDKDGIVWMSGTANSQQEIDKAVSIAKSTDGVKSVKNDITVQKDK